MAVRARTALALVVFAIAVAILFWPDDHARELTARSATGGASQRDSSTKSSDYSVESPTQKAPVEAAMTPRQTTSSGTFARPSGSAIQVDVRAPSNVHSGDSFQVTVDVQAARSLRQIAFSISYKQSILRLVGSSPGAFAQQSGALPTFAAEEPSDGAILVSLYLDNGVIAGAGSVVVLEFEALKRGVSPLTVHSVTYVESGRQDTLTSPAGYEGTITVE
jgi:cytoskeletal protein RodZ